MMDHVDGRILRHSARADPDLPGLTVCDHWVYTRKCVLPSESGGIILPEKSQEPWGCEKAVWHEVLAIGRDCGKPRDRRADKRKGREAYSMVNDLRPGDMVMAPPDHPWGIRHSPLSPDEFFLDESILLAVKETAA